MKKLFSIIFILNLLILPALAETKQITILYTNDTHNRLIPYNTKSLTNIGGIVRRTNLINKIRIENPNTLVLDAGDIFQGTPLYNFFKGELDFWAMSIASYDATTIGNHDLDDGLLNLKKQSQYAAFPVLCANITDTKGYLIFRPYSIFRLDNVRIGVIGLIGNDAWSSVALRYKQDLIFKDPIDTAKKLVPIVRQYADIIVLLTHNGYNEDLQLAKNVPNIDIIIGGHSHTTLDKPKLVEKIENKNGINGTLILQSGWGGIYLGKLDLNIDIEELDLLKSRNYKIKDYNSQLIEVNQSYDIPKDNILDKKISEYLKKIEQITSEVIGEATTTLDVSRKYFELCPLGKFVTQVMKDTFKVDIAIINSGGLREELPKGPITIGKIYEIMPFDNAIVKFDWTGKRIKEFIEYNYSRLGKNKNFQFSGVTYKTKDNKVIEILVNGKLLDLNKKYSVVTVDYVFSGNEDFKFLDTSNVNLTSILLRDIVIEHIKKHKKI